MDDARAPGEGAHKLLVGGVALLLSVALVGSLWAVPYLPTNDGPQPLFSAWLHNHLRDPGAHYERYVGAHTPLTWAGFSFLFRPLERLLPWRDALRATLSLVALGWAWGYLALVRALEPRRLAVGLLGFATALQWSLYMGFFSFLAASAVGLWLVALALRSPPTWSPARAALFALLLYVQARMHVLGAELTGFALVLLALKSAPRAQWLRLALAGLPALVVAAQTALAAPAIARSLVSRTLWFSPLNAVRLLWRGFTSGPSWRAVPPVLLAAAGLAWGVYRWRKGASSPRERGLLLAAAALLGLALALPVHLRSWEFFSPRFSPYGVLLACALLPVESLGARARSLFALALGAFALASVGWSAGYHRALYARHEDVFGALEAPLRRQGPRLTLSVVSGAAHSAEEVPFADPLMHAPQLFLLAQGGAGTSTFMLLPELHEVQRLEHDDFPPVPAQRLTRQLRDAGLPPERRRALLELVAYGGVPFTDLVAIASPSDAAYWIARGYEPALHRGRLFLGSFRGCTARVEVRGPLAAPLRAALGWPGRAEEFSSAALAPAAPAATFSRSPCGPVWVRVEGLPPGARCQEAGPEGRLGLSVSPEGSTAVCTLAAPGAT